MKNINEKDLIWKAKNNDNEAMKELIKKYNGLIWKLANSLGETCETLEIEDLYQEGVLGLMLAVKRFDMDSDVKLITYAYYYIRGSMLHAMHNLDRLVKYPSKTIEKIENIKRKINELKIKLSRNVSFQEILQNTDITYEELNEFLVLNQKVARLEDVKLGYNSTEEVDCVDLDLQLEDDFNLEETIINKTLADMVYNSPKLKDIEKQILYCRFHDEMTLRETANITGFSKEGVRKVEARCLEYAKNNIIK